MDIFYSNKIVLSDDVIKGYIVVDKGRIVDIQKDKKPEQRFVDLTDRFVLPGFINIMSDDYAREVKSPYNKFFSEKKIFHQLDRRLAEAGVTTNFHTFHLEELLKERSVEDIIEYLGTIKKGPIDKHLIDHRIHLMFKLGTHLVNKNLRELILSGVVDFVTCTGLYSKDVFNYQNQYFVQQLQERFDLDDEQASLVLQKLIGLREDSALDELSYRIRCAKNTQLPFASDRYKLAKRLKDEYKIDIDMLSGDHTRETMDQIKESGICYAYDVENIIRPKCSSELMELLSERVIDVITASDRSKDILEYIFEIEGTLGLPQAVKLFAQHPAKAVNLNDRGSIDVGKKADFVVVEMIGDMPTIAMTISDGRIVVQYH